LNGSEKVPAPFSEPIPPLAGNKQAKNFLPQTPFIFCLLLAEPKNFCNRWVKPNDFYFLAVNPARSETECGEKVIYYQSIKKPN